ncbi:MAG: hypothetical protein R6W73_05880 [Candidatus Saliniplasma sp.]
MTVKEKIKNALTLTPRLFKREINKNRSSVPFLISISFLASFIGARLWVIYLGAAETTPPPTSVGRNVVLGGYHIHHITYGIILISISAWLSINYWSRSIVRISSILYGLGLGLVIEQLGFIIGGIEAYRADIEVFFIAVLIIAILLSVVYFPSFYSSMKRDIKRWRRIFQR